MSPTTLLVLYCLLIMLASIAGGLIPLLLRLTHTRLQVAISFTAGFMFGIAILHMIPHAVVDPAAGGAKNVMLGVLGGFLAMFFIERFFSFHTHEVAELDEQGNVQTSAEQLHDHGPDEHAHHHGHVQAHGMAGPTAGNPMHWTGAAVGLTLHSIIGGIALASAVAAEAHLAAAWAGVAVFLVILLHKPLDALTVITLTATAGYGKLTRHLINGVFAFAVPVGVVLFMLTRGPLGGEASGFTAYALAFSAGTFLCIALSDLLPELHFHAHDRGKLSVALLLGVGIAWGVAMAEHSMHDHDHGHGHGHGAPQDHADHPHDDHEPHPADPPSLHDWIAPDGRVVDSHEGHDHGDHDHQGHDQ
jgi:zinc and cadmium transporter